MAVIEIVFGVLWALGWFANLYAAGKGTGAYATRGQLLFTGFLMVGELVWLLASAPLTWFGWTLAVYFAIWIAIEFFMAGTGGKYFGMAFNIAGIILAPIFLILLFTVGIVA